MDLLDFLFCLAAVFYAGWEGGRTHQIKRDMKMVDDALDRSEAK